MSLEELREVFVQRLLNPVRFDLYGKLYTLVSRLQQNQVVCELWIDGSFVTNKPEPDDIDLSVMIDVADYEKLTEPALQLLDDLVYVEAKYLDVLDAFVCIVHEEGDPRRSEDDPVEYAELWGIEHNKNYLKGFVAVRVTP